MLLELRDIEVRYQKIAALKGVSMAVPAGGIVTIIGANGAGKTTTLRAISGLEPLTRGEIRFDDARIDGLAPEEIVRRGIAHVPEGRRVFPDLTVEGKPAHRRLSAQEQGCRPGLVGRLSSTASRASPSGGGNGRDPCPAASSRCWRSAGR